MNEHKPPAPILINFIIYTLMITLLKRMSIANRKISGQHFTAALQHFDIKRVYNFKNRTNNIDGPNLGPYPFLFASDLERHIDGCVLRRRLHFPWQLYCYGDSNVYRGRRSISGAKCLRN